MAKEKPKRKKKPKPPIVPGPGPREGWRILALDPAQSTGWAYTRGKWGIEKFTKRPWRHPFAHYLDYRAWLLERIDELDVTALATEAVLSTGGFGNGQRHEWHGITLAVAAECDLPIVQVMPSSLKKYATGDGRAERPAMQQALGERFGIWLPERDHDAIAAIWVLSWATAEMKEGRIVREWSGFPRDAAGREGICNRCQLRFEGGMVCPRCGTNRTRLES